MTDLNSPKSGSSRSFFSHKRRSSKLERKLRYFQGAKNKDSYTSVEEILSKNEQEDVYTHIYQSSSPGREDYASSTSKKYNLTVNIKQYDRPGDYVNRHKTHTTSTFKSPKARNLEWHFGKNRMTAKRVELIFEKHAKIAPTQTSTSWKNWEPKRRIQKEIPSELPLKERLQRYYNKEYDGYYSDREEPSEINEHNSVHTLDNFQWKEAWGGKVKVRTIRSNSDPTFKIVARRNSRDGFVLKRSNSDINLRSRNYVEGANSSKVKFAVEVKNVVFHLDNSNSQTNMITENVGALKQRSESAIRDGYEEELEGARIAGLFDSPSCTPSPKRSNCLNYDGWREFLPQPGKRADGEKRFKNKIPTTPPASPTYFENQSPYDMENFIISEISIREEFHSESHESMTKSIISEPHETSVRCQTCIIS